MKKYIFLSFFLLSASILGLSQFRANVSEGPDNRIVFRVRPSVNVDNSGYSTIEFFVRYPKSAPAFTYGPVLANTVNFPGMTTWVVEQKKSQDADFFYDWFYYTGPSPITTQRDYVANTEYEVIRVPVVGPAVSAIGFTLVHHELEDLSYYVFTNHRGFDNRPELLTDYFYPATSVSGPVSNRVYSQDIVLPVDFKSFYAMKSGDDAKLLWNVSNDEKNAYFDVMRSTDGRNFRSIQKINGLRNGNSDNSYETIDYNLSKLGSRDVYYQIKQTDIDGKSTTSPVRKLSVDGLGKAVAAFPNPARTSTKLTVDAPESGKGAIIMRDNLGRQVQNINALFNKGINHFELNVMNLPSGDYNISVMGGGLNETIKIQKIQ